MALSLKNVAKHSMPVGPRCFRSYRGMRLSPELLFALKLLLITSVSSVGEMWYCGASVSGVNVSIGMDSS